MSPVVPFFNIVRNNHGFYITDPKNSPVNLTVIGITSTSISLQWSNFTLDPPVRGTLRSFLLQYYTVHGLSDNNPGIKGVDINTLSTELEGLYSFTLYRIVISACTTWCGPPSVPVQARTDEGGNAVQGTK